MIVYRTINKIFFNQYENHEKIKGSNINSILHGRNVGISYNNHNYTYDVNYIHFFKDLFDALDLKKQRFTDKQEECIILAFDIPEKILKKYEGRGGYDFNSTISTAVEYAIPEKVYQPKWYSNIFDETKIELKEREQIDYSEIKFGFYGQTNEVIDAYIQQHVINNNSKELERE